ncbi:MAG TPA: LolA-related protein [Casimicrobiaceae bacterium]|nr:LolA-related protein [Casimicrobiaceae bacterium]
MKRVVATIALLLIATPILGQSISVSQLMTMLAGVSESQARFTETRESSLLKAPLVVSGQLAYRRPDRLEKRIETPFAEVTVIDGTRITVSKGGAAERSYSVPTGAPRALVESLRATLAGDLAALERYFVVHASGVADAWKLVLIPKTAELSNYVTRVEIAGNKVQLSRIEVVEASGDRSLTDLKPAQK